MCYDTEQVSINIRSWNHTTHLFHSQWCETGNQLQYKKMEKTNTWRLNRLLLITIWLNKEIKEGIKKHLENYEKFYTNQLDNLEEIYKFLETSTLPRLNKEETENMNRLITSNKIELVIENSQQTKIQDQSASFNSQDNSIKHLYKS